jgi:hypothetical protein
VRKVIDFELDEIWVPDELGPDLNNTILTFYTCSKYSLLPEEEGRMNSAADRLYDVIRIYSHCSAHHFNGGQVQPDS